MASVINITKGVGTAVHRTEGWNIFMDSIRKIPMLNQEQEEELMREYVSSTNKNRKIEIRNILIQANQRFVVAAAKQYANNDIELLFELISEANLGFAEAIESFDFSKAKEKMRICSWASFYIRRSINQYMQNHGSMVKQTNSVLIGYKLSKVRNILTQEFEREPTDEEILEYFEKNDISLVKDVKDLIKVRVSSVDTFYDNDEDKYDATVADFNSSTASYSDAEQTIENDYTKAIIAKGMSALNEREQKVIKMLYGLGSSTVAYSMEVIAEMFDYSTERIRQIHATALKKMASKLSLSSKRI